MNICVVAHYFPARSETWILGHVIGLAKKGHKVTVISRLPDPDFSHCELNEIDDSGIRRIYVGNYSAFSTKITTALNCWRAAIAIIKKPWLRNVFMSRGPWSLRQLLIAEAISKLVQRNSFDLVHVHFGDMAARLHLVSREIKEFPPLVATWHGYDANSIPNQLGSGVYRNSFSSEVIHTVGTNFLMNKLINLGIGAGVIQKIPLGIDLDFITNLGRVPYKSGPLKVLSVGRLDEVKGHDFLIDAIGILRKKNVQVTLRIIGDGPMRALLSEKIRHKNLTDCVELLGAVDSETVVQEMRKADLFALAGVETKTGKAENQGMVLAEAQATGLPVISTRVGGIPEAIVEMQTGMLCDSRNSLQFAETIEELLKEPEKMKAFGMAGRLNAEKHFSINVMLSRFETLYHEVVSRPPL